MVYYNIKLTKIHFRIVTFFTPRRIFSPFSPSVGGMAALQTSNYPCSKKCSVNKKIDTPFLFPIPIKPCSKKCSVNKKIDKAFLFPILNKPCCTKCSVNKKIEYRFLTLIPNKYCSKKCSFNKKIDNSFFPIQKN